MKKCNHCKKREADNPWKLQACADKRRKREFVLCDPCDIRLNKLVLAFFNDPRTAQKIAAYRA